MHEENTVSLKVYVMEGENNIEIRRFEVDQGVITNYDYIRERFQLAIPKLREKIFKLLWQDNDGDEVTISSDEELMIALSEFKSNVCKFIVRLPPSADEMHINVKIPNLSDLFSTLTSFAGFCPLFTEIQAEMSCNSCKQPLTSIRYKCVECVRYYQCGECEHKQVHPEHMMLRLTKSPNAESLVPKCIQIFKNHLARGSRCPGMFAKGGLREKSSRHHSDKDKFHSRRKCRKSGYHSDNKTSSQDESQSECPFSTQGFGNLGNVINAFLGMYNDGVTNSADVPKTSKVQKSPGQPQTIKTVDIDAGPAAPVALSDDDDDDDDNARMEAEPVVPSTSASNDKKDAKLEQALEMLSEMGFNDENKWLTKLLEHFNGDIAKTLDHLTLGK
ncbi:refractory to sigma P [Carabus blaptoides fortunei]